MDTKVKKAAFQSSRSLINYRREHTAFTLKHRGKDKYPIHRWSRKEMLPAESQQCLCSSASGQKASRVYSHPLHPSQH